MTDSGGLEVVVYSSVLGSECHYHTGFGRSIFCFPLLYTALLLDWLFSSGVVSPGFFDRTGIPETITFATVTASGLSTNTDFGMGQSGHRSGTFACK